MRALHATRICLGVVLSGAAGAATVSGDDLARCASIAAPTSRLACYDALAQRAPDAIPPARAASGAAAATPALATAPHAAATPAANVASPEDPKDFGLSAAQRHVAFVGPKQESARIVSLSANQAGHSTIVLDSGQTWTVLDDDGRLSYGDQVTIKRASLGSFLLTAPSHHTYRVHRVQ